MGRSWARLRRAVSSALFIGFGVAVGIVVGTVWPVPGMLRDWLRGPVETVVLGRRNVTPPKPPPTAELEAFRKLQAGRGEERAAPAPRSTPAPTPDVSAPPPSRGSVSEGSAARVIADLAERRHAVLPSAPEPGTGRSQTGAPGPDEPVVQVAAYVDRPAAEALERRLVRLGFRAYVTDGRPGGEMRYRVRVRPATGQGAEELSTALRRHGFSVWVTQE